MKKESVFGAVSHNDFREDAPFDDQIEVSPLQLFLNAEYLLKMLGVSGPAYVEDRGSGPLPWVWGFWRAPETGWRDIPPLDAHFLMKSRPLGMMKPIQDLPANIFDDADKFNAVAFRLEPGASFLYWAFVGKRVPSVAMIL